MDIIKMIYDILLIVLFSISAFTLIIMHMRTRNYLFLLSSILFICFILDNLVITMTEFIPDFAATYDNSLVTAATFKTLIYAVSFFCFVRCTEKLSGLKAIYPFYFLLAGMTLAQIFIPMMQNTAFKVWLYFSLGQFYMLIFTAYCLILFRRKKISYTAPQNYSILRLIMTITFVFSLIILMEDSIVIFFYDNYSSVFVIQNRSYSEDIMRTLYTIILLMHTLPVFKNDVSPFSTPEEESDTCSISVESTENTAASYEESGSDSDINSKKLLDSFSQKYMLTTREKEIIFLLLDNKSNTDISEKLCISLGTTKVHIHNIYSKLGINKRTQLIEKYNSFSEE